MKHSHFTIVIFLAGDLKGLIKTENLLRYFRLQGREDEQECAFTVCPFFLSLLQHCTTKVVSIEGVQANFEAFEKGCRAK